MKPHVKNYLKYHGLSPVDFIPCKICQAEANDIHHIKFKGMGGANQDDSASNLIALCRRCHEYAHEGRFSKKYLFANNGVD